MTLTLECIASAPPERCLPPLPIAELVQGVCSQNAQHFLVLLGDTCGCGFDTEFPEDEQDIGVPGIPLRQRR